jgi:hypothetical protein
MKLSLFHLAAVLLIGVAIGMALKGAFGPVEPVGLEGFQAGGALQCGGCGGGWPCSGGCPSPDPRPICPACPPCREPDMSKYVLKSTIPPCPVCPDLSNYVLKSEIPPVPDLSNYVLKSSIPEPQPVILDCSKCNKPKGECPPCPRARCPEVKCPEPTQCPACAPCPRPSCPPAVVKCKAETENQDGVRPFLAPLSYRGFGMN